MVTPIAILWRYRDFIFGSVLREFQVRYRDSLLGASWSIFNPLAMIAVYTLIFAQVMRTRLPEVESVYGYSIFLCAGLLTWGLFAEIVNRSLVVFLENANLLKKVSFPRLCLPILVACTALLNFAIIFGLFTGFLVLSGNFPGAVYLAVLPLIAIQVALAMGLGVALGLLNVFFRDVGQLAGIGLQFWFWLTPIIYPLSVLPEWAQRLMQLNPMYWLARAYQTILVRGQWPDWGSLLPVALLALFLCWFGMRLFRRRSGEIVDEL
jgi:lipopolysaccharide transport system permease protein